MPLSQRNVACGGTFDCMHAGHRLLLAATALASNERVLIGVTGDLLLAKKKYASHLQSYDDRARAAASYVKGEDRHEMWTRTVDGHNGYARVDTRSGYVAHAGTWE